jgi:hypothetical protein
MALRRVPTLLCAAALCAVLPACGSKSGERDPFGAAPAGTSGATAAGDAAGLRRADGAAARLRAAGEAKGCRGIRALLHPAYGDVTASACEATKALVKNMRAAHAAAYGPAAVVDFRSGGRQRAAIFAPGKGSLRLAFIEDVPEPTVNTLFAPDFDKAAQQSLDLAVTGNCLQLAQVAHRSIGPALDEKRACDALPGSPLVKALKAQPKLEPKRLGGSSFYAFYSLAPKSGPAFTLILAQQDPAEVPAVAAATTGASGASGATGTSGAAADQALIAAASVPRYAFVDALPVG